MPRQTDWALAKQLSDLFPGTFGPMQRLVAAAADTCAEPGDVTYAAFDEMFAETIRALAAERPEHTAMEYREDLVFVLSYFQRAFPNWQEAYSFLGKLLLEDAGFAEAKIRDILG